MCALWQTLTTQREKDGHCPPWVPNLETCKQLNKYKYYLRDMDTTKPNARNLDLCIKLSEKASRRRCRWCWYLTHNDTYISILSRHFPVKFLQIFWAFFTWIWNTERTALAFSHDHFSQFHAALSVDSKWGLWMLWAGFSCCGFWWNRLYRLLYSLHVWLHVYFIGTIPALDGIKYDLPLSSRCSPFLFTCIQTFWFRQWFSSCGSQTSSISIAWNPHYKYEFFTLNPNLLNRNLLGWAPRVCDYKTLLGDSNAW